jgi:hypothetical protein
VALAFRRMLLPPRAKEAPTLMACGMWQSSPSRELMTEDWLEHMLRRGEELARRLVTTPTPPLTAAGRRYLDTYH